MCVCVCVCVCATVMCVRMCVYVGGNKKWKIIRQCCEKLKNGFDY